MTNLIEKSLITGFGIFALILFLILITPFFQELENYNENEDNDEDLEDFKIFINKIDVVIKYFIEHPGSEIFEEIEYPKNINITFINNYAKFDFIIDNKIQNKILSYNDQFLQKYYNNMTPKTYKLNVTRNTSLISVDFKDKE